MSFVSVIQHTSADYLGLMEDHLEGRGIRFKYYRPFTEGNVLPEPGEIGDGLILLGGGPWGTAGGRDLPSLAREVSLTYAALMMGRPVIGLELGAQILALAADGKSEAAPLALDLGFATRTEDNALRGFLPERFAYASYMRDYPVPPDYARVLARDERQRPALFQIGENCFGFAAHPGFKPAIAEDLVMEFEDYPPDAPARLEKLRGLKAGIEDALVPIMTGLIAATGLMGA